MLRRCPLSIVQRFVHCTISVSTAVLGRVTRTTQSQRSLTFAAQLHLLAYDLFWANLRVRIHLPPLDLARNPVLCPTLWFVQMDYNKVWASDY